MKMHATWDSVCELSVMDFGKLVALLPVSVEDANLLGHYWGKEACQRMRRAIAGRTMQSSGEESVQNGPIPADFRV